MRSMDLEAWPTDRRTKLYRDYVYTCHSNLHWKFQLSIFNSRRENHIFLLVLRTGWRTDLVNYRVASILKWKRHACLYDVLLFRLGFKKMTPVQASVIPMFLQRKGKIFSSLASKPIYITWIWTGSQPYGCIASYYKQWILK